MSQRVQTEPDQYTHIPLLGNARSPIRLVGNKHDTQHLERPESLDTLRLAIPSLNATLSLMHFKVGKLYRHSLSLDALIRPLSGFERDGYEVLDVEWLAASDGRQLALDVISVRIEDVSHWTELPTDTFHRTNT